MTNKNINIIDNKICINCNSTLHEYQKCPEPKTSWGIILVKIFDNNISLKHDKINNIKNINKLILNNEEDLKKYSSLVHSIKFLLISRKHSLAYIEFVRGRYKEENFLGIKGLFEQMMKSEIENIDKNDFDTIWNDFWGDHEYKLKLKNEYHESKIKFNKLRYGNDIKVKLDFYTKRITPNYSIPEWGIPKGRKKYGERDIDCAIREFMEETQLKESDFKVLHHIEPIVENMYGTDGKKYKHIYFIAESTSDICNINLTNSEVGNIGYFSYSEACDILRPYHTEKRKILESVLNYYLSIVIDN